MDQTTHYIFLSTLISFIALVFILLGYVIYKRTNKVKQVFIDQARKRNGEVIPGFLSYPKLIFDYYSHKVKIYVIPGGKYSPPTTHFEVKLSFSINHKIRVYKEGFGSKIGKTLGAQDIQVGYPDFDNEFMVKSEDEYFISSLLSSGIQERLLSIKKYSPSLLIYGNLAVIHIPNLYLDEYFFDEVINTVLKIVDKLNEAKMY